MLGLEVAVGAGVGEICPGGVPGGMTIGCPGTGVAVVTTVAVAIGVDEGVLVSAGVGLGVGVT